MAICPLLFTLLLSARARCMTWRVNFVRSKDAQKQLARTSLKAPGQKRAHVLTLNERKQGYTHLFLPNKTSKQALLISFPSALLFCNGASIGLHRIHCYKGHEFRRKISDFFKIMEKLYLYLKDSVFILIYVRNLKKWLFLNDRVKSFIRSLTFSYQSLNRNYLLLTFNGRNYFLIFNV